MRGGVSGLGGSAFCAGRARLLGWCATRPKTHGHPLPSANTFSIPLHPCPLQLRGDDRFAMVNWRRMFQLLVTVVRQYMPGGCSRSCRRGRALKQGLHRDRRASRLERYPVPRICHLP